MYWGDGLTGPADTDGPAEVATCLRGLRRAAVVAPVLSDLGNSGEAAMTFTLTKDELGLLTGLLFLLTAFCIFRLAYRPGKHWAAWANAACVLALLVLVAAGLWGRAA